MEILSTNFLMALLTIIAIGLAAPNVPAHLQKRIVLRGTAGAIATRIVFTLGIVWLLKIPGLILPTSTGGN